jgi:carbonic anhydrase
LILGGLGTWLAQRMVPAPTLPHNCDPSHFPVPATDPYTPEDALTRLLAGNKRFVEGRAQGGPLMPVPTPMLARDYRPIAAIVSCSDARLDCETLFDERAGDLFVIRQPALLLDGNGISALEYAVGYLRVPLILVLGHTHCHTLASVLAAAERPEPTAGLDYLTRELNSVVKDVQGQPGEPLDNLVTANVRRVVRQLRSAQPLRDATNRRTVLRENRLLIQGARCVLPSGTVVPVELP